MGIYYASPSAKPVSWRSIGKAEFTIPAYKDVTLQAEWKVPVDTKLYAIEPESGFFGATLKLVAKLPTGATKTVALINHWSPFWQGSYQFLKPVVLPKGTVLIATSRYKNTLGDSHDINHVPQEPREMRSGNDAQAERFWMHLAVSP